MKTLVFKIKTQNSENKAKLLPTTSCYATDCLRANSEVTGCLCNVNSEGFPGGGISSLRALGRAWIWIWEFPGVWKSEI